MGSLLTETPTSESMATLEILGKAGVTRESMKFTRSNPGLQVLLAYLMNGGKFENLEFIMSVWDLGFHAYESEVPIKKIRARAEELGLTPLPVPDAPGWAVIAIDPTATHMYPAYHCFYDEGGLVPNIAGCMRLIFIKKP